MLDFKDFYFENQDAFINEVKEELNLLINEKEFVSSNINPIFISRLTNYLEKRFPNFGDLNQAVSLELRQYLSGDNSYFKSVRQKIYDIINKSKNKFLRDVHNKVDKIKILPKEEPAPPIVNYDPLMSDEPMQGEAPPNASKQF